MSKRHAVHLTSVHPRDDTRIFIKECRSLAGHGYQVTLVVADGKGDERRDGVCIVDVGKPSGRLDRMLRGTRRILGRALSLDADIHHIHDPELLPVGLRLKRLGKKVVFDSHEDVPRQILGKHYLHPAVRWALSILVSRYETYVCPQLDGIVAATPFIRDKFLALTPRCVDINNFPIQDELHSPSSWVGKQAEVCYVGGISGDRGIRELVRACQLLDTPTRLNLAGRFMEPGLAREVMAKPGWSRVNEHGFLDRAGVRNVLARSVAGLVTLHPITNYLDALPVKMFEYMAVGIPVIASNFPLWREIVEGNACGLCVDPLDPAGIARAIDFLMSNPDTARRMGENGRRAVLEKYNWQCEEKKLLAFYEDLLSTPPAGACRPPTS